ncbi:MAG: hypothetical protein ACOX75_05185 [Lachnospiraceae bacterium]|jgi:hypothetical protein
MKRLISLKNRLVGQFRNHPIRSSLIASGIALVVIVGSLLVSGVIDFGGLNLNQSGFDYLPDREYVLGSKEDERPQTLNELLYSQSPDIEDFLHSPDIAAELLAADSLVDIVDSRYALNNLREIGRQLEERTKEDDPPMGDLVTLRSSPIEQPVKEKSPGPEDDLKPYMPEPAPLQERDPLPKSEGAERLDSAAESIDFSRPEEPDQARKSYNHQQNIFEKLDTKVSDLLKIAEYGEWERMPSSINMKGIWQNPGESLIHMIPEADWLPETGYRVYRQIGDEKELIAEKLAAAQTVLAQNFQHPQAENISQIYQAAEYTEEDRSILGMDEATFHDKMYQTRPMLQEVVHMGGETDFLLMKQAQITIPDGVDQKMPESDRGLNSPVQIMNLPENGRYEAGSIRSRLWEQYSVRQSELPSGIRNLGEPGTEGENKLYDAAATTLGARQQISTLAFVDDEFAEEAGFLFRDDLSGKKLSNGEQIIYTIESPGGQSASVKLYWGKELPLTKPEGFLGYGLDGKVFLRWRKPANEAEGKIISGYFIERKLEGESDFVPIHEKPIVITEVLDETGVFFETPVMYQEKLANGKKAQYRLYSIDIFGRRSECCDPIDIRVEKVTPPDAPTASSPVLAGKDAPVVSDDALGKAIQKSIAKNKRKEGIVIPIFNESPDTVRFTLYRAEAVGTGAYSEPVPLANFRFKNPKKKEGGKEGTLPDTVPPELLEDGPQAARSAGFFGLDSGQYDYGKLFGAKHLFLKTNEPLAPDMIYFDANIKKGVTYKYWVSAWDSWDNESAWSKSCAIGVPTQKEPSVPDKLIISMMTRKLPDLSCLSPGLVFDDNISPATIEENSEKPDRLSAENTSLVEMADISGTQIGSFIGKNGAPLILSRFFDNLPDQKYIHVFLGVRGKDVLPDGSARLKWPAYSGDNLGGYVAYQLQGESPSREIVSTLDREELMAMGQWTRLTDNVLEQNQYLVQGLNPGGDGVHLFLICLEPADESSSSEEDGTKDGTGELSLNLLKSVIGGLPINQNPEGGFVLLEWEEPQDLQIKYYRIYRSEVSNFKKPVNESDLEWTLVGDQISGTQYTDPVEQSHAHYYYYKITAVSPWGVESSVGTVEKFRVPSTKPPQTPNLLLPLSRKDGIQVNFSSVEYCCRYEVYRAEIPKITAEKLKSIDPSIMERIFTTPSVSDEFLTTILKEGTDSARSGSDQMINALLGFKTVNLSQPLHLSEKLTQVDVSRRQDAYSKIIHELGPLAVSDYRDLSINMMGFVKWEKIGELPVEEDTEEQIDPDTGLKKSLSITDYDVKYGTHYLYTVQAWNDDELGSTRPEPVEATPRRNRGFDPIDGLEFTISHGEFPSINLSWNEPRMEGLTPEQCLEDTVGYIVYYSTEKDGIYVQASPLLFSTGWSDYKTDRAATNWYKVRVLDTGGYLSDFSEPILARENVTIELPKTEIPGEAPSISMDPLYYSVGKGNELRIPFTVSGSQPIRFEVSAWHNSGQDEAGIIVPEGSNEVLVPDTMMAGTYEVTITAINDAGEAEVTFSLEILENYLLPPRIFDIDIPLLGHDEEAAFHTLMLTDAANSPAGGAVTADILTGSCDRNQEDAGSLLSFRLEPESSPHRTSALTENFASQIPEPTMLSARLPGTLPRNVVTQPSGGQNILSGKKYKSNSGDFSGFALRNIVLEDLEDSSPAIGYIRTPVFTGSAELLFGEPGVGQILPVCITGANFKEENGKTVFTDGILYVDKPYKLEEIGITISSLNIPFNDVGTASGFVQNANPSKNAIGNLSGFAFTNAIFRGNTDLYIGLKQGEKSVLPEIRLDRLTLDRVSSVTISLDTNKDSEKVLQFVTEATLKAPLETLSNEGIRMIARGLSCDAHGRITGSLETTDTTPGAGEQFLQLLVPGGAGLKVTAGIVYKKGVPTNEGFIRGRIILPFEQAEYMGPGVPGNYASSHSTINIMDYMMHPRYDKEKYGDLTTTEFFIKFGQTVQKNGLLIVPADSEMQKNCAYAEFSVNNWMGEGFLVESADLTPVRVAERSLKMKDQRDQGIIVSPTQVSIDLDRNTFFAATAGSQTPQETEEPFWVGMIFKGGHLTLPTAFVQTASGDPINFRLAEGEMIYDLNGFNYQTFLYSDSEEGVPAEFGNRLGGFKQVRVHDCLLDMYANKVNLEINAEVALELFNNNRVKVKLYTNKEDNENGKGGEFLCSVAPTVIENFVGLNTELTIDGGFLEPEGMRFGGSIKLTTPEIQLEEPMKFTTMVVPAKKTDTFADNNADKLHAWATLDKTTPVHMQGFSLDIREINFEYLSKTIKDGTPTRLSLWGSVLLSEEIAIGTETTDCIALDTLKGPELELPVVIYDKSYSVLETSFDECIDVKGVLVPRRLTESGSQSVQESVPMTATHASMLPIGRRNKVTTDKADEKIKQIEKGLIEFETENLNLGFLGSLGELPIDTITRFGYDVDNARCYFSIGMLKKDGGGDLDVGLGSMDRFSGLVASNMIVERDEQKHLIFPDGKAEMKKFISDMPVDRSKDAKFNAAVKGDLNIKKVAQVRDLYFGFESGPLVEASGGLYLPLDVEVILNPSSDGFKHVGDVKIIYSHPERYFSFNMTLNEVDMIAVKLSGSLGFEFSPKLFGVYVGYPETLAGNVGIYRVGLGLGFRLDDDGANIIKGKIEFGFERSVNVSIVYLRGFLYAGADGGYYANYQDADGNYLGEKFILTLYLKGGLEGGIKVAGKRYNIINMYLDARGTIESIPPQDDWKLTCSAKVSYSLNLFLFSVNGSVSASFDTTL